MKCTECRFCILQDYGYSNYSVCGTEADCLKNLNPDLPCDTFYDEEPALLYAERCGSFESGRPVEVDVDEGLGELSEYSDDPEIKGLLYDIARREGN